MTLNNALRTDFATVLNTDFGGGTLEIRTGSSPGAGSAATGTLLASITLPATPFSISNGVATKTGTWSTTAAASGTAGYVRVKDSGGTKIMDLTVGTSGAEVNLDNTNIATGQTVAVSSGTITFPAS
jgi:hypothetical protein